MLHAKYIIYLTRTFVIFEFKKGVYLFLFRTPEPLPEGIHAMWITIFLLATLVKTGNTFVIFAQMNLDWNELGIPFWGALEKEL